ncbi:hypothetical protein MRX96_023781 [Rhipicephalus microplus]
MSPANLRHQQRSSNVCAHSTTHATAVWPGRRTSKSERRIDASINNGSFHREGNVLKNVMENSSYPTHRPLGRQSRCSYTADTSTKGVARSPRSEGATLNSLSLTPGPNYPSAVESLAGDPGVTPSHFESHRGHSRNAHYRNQEARTADRVRAAAATHEEERGEESRSQARWQERACSANTHGANNSRRRVESLQTAVLVWYVLTEKK